MFLKNTPGRETYADVDMREHESSELLVSEQTVKKINNLETYNL